jgi:hypothetical protein
MDRVHSRAAENRNRQDPALQAARLRRIRGWRLPLLILGFASLAFGVAGGLARLGFLESHSVRSAVGLHGALMVSGFFGTVIALERAVALGRLWAYAAPACAGLGGACLLLGFVPAGFTLLALAAAIFSAASVMVVVRQPALESATLLAGALAWLAGNVLQSIGLAAVPWWIAFFALTIGGERLELSRYLKRGPWVRRSFLVIALAMLFSPPLPRVLGAILVLLALWLFAFDLARFTVKQTRLPRYVAVCLLTGYFWLAVGGALMAASTGYDAALHAVFVGFVFSMVFGHAPVILPAVLRVAVPYSAALYAPLALLHASLAARVAGGLLAEDAELQRMGALGNAAAIALFIVVAATLVLVRLSRASSARPKPTAPGQ